MKTIKCAILGHGNRGSVYGKHLAGAAGVVVSAVCDINRSNLEAAAAQYNLNKENCYESDTEFFKEKRADVLVIASMDRSHFKHAAAAIQLGYDILLEKPIALSAAECRKLEKMAAGSTSKIVVCHVLRYTPFFNKIRELCARPEFGEIAAVSESENIDFVHYWLSFLHGNWQNSKSSSPIILQKCSHDFDLISWIVGRSCKKVSSFANLKVYKRENAPVDSAMYCYECKYRDSCTYSGIRIMTRQPAWLKEYFPEMEMSGEGVRKILSDPSNRYSKCAYKEDNDVMSGQVVNLLFENGLVAQHFMSGFSAVGRREIKIHATKGEISGVMGPEESTIRYRLFQEPAEEFSFDGDAALIGHGGGDRNIITDFIDYLRTGEKKDNLTLLSDSLMSHRIAFAAEESRKKHGIVITV